MAYKVFFAFQMDTEDKYGKGFIQQAIESAIQKLKAEGIEVKLDFGFRGTPGTPLLIDEMLRKSSESDMVVVDLTFTSAKEWLNAELIEEDDTNSWYSIPKGDRKPSPNPNVLLEMGFAWATKGRYRTLAVMNTAFGDPDKLPVDLKGFRWGITYSLDSSNYEDRKAERNNLIGALYDAIKAAINSEAEYQQEKLNPIRLYQNWSPKDFQTIYKPTKKAEDIITKLRVDLEGNTHPQRIVGPKNSGKTRLSYEIYRSINSSLQEHSNLKKVLYYDLNGKDHHFIEGKLQYLRKLNQRKILILDNCPIKVHNIVFNEYFHDTEISLLTIGDTEDGKGATHSLDTDYATEIIEKLSNETGDPQNTSFIQDRSQGNLREAIAIIGKIPEGENRLSVDYHTRWKQILGEVTHIETALEVLEEVAMFTHIGYNNEHQYQSNFLLQNTAIKNYDELEEVIDQLSKTSILKVSGDFIILEAFINELATRRLERLVEEDITTYLSQISEYKLSGVFSNQLIELRQLSGANTLINTLIQKINYDILDSDQGARIVLTLSEIIPLETANALASVLRSRTYEELEEFRRGRRNIIYALERLVYREETFEVATELLFRLAVSENEIYGNNATGQFCQLFQALLPATTATLDARIKFLEKLISNAQKEEVPVIEKTLSRALMTRGFTRAGGAEKQIDQEFKDYEPESTEEILAYWKCIIEILKSRSNYKILVDNFSSQVSGGNTLAMLQAIDEMLNGRAPLNKELRQQIDYLINDSKTVNNEIKSSLKELLDKYTDGTIRERLQYEVALAPYSSYRTEDGKLVSKSEEIAQQLAEEIVKKDNLDWLKDIDILISGEQRQSYTFGMALGEKKPKFYELINVVSEQLSLTPTEEQNNLLVEGYLLKVDDDNFKREVIDTYLAKEEIAYHAIRMTKLLKIEMNDLQKLYPLIQKKPRYASALQFLSLTALSEENLTEFINWLKVIEPFGWWVAIDLCQRTFEKRDSMSEELLKLSRDLLMKEGILKVVNAHVPFALHQYVELLKLVSKEKGIDDGLAVFIATDIVNSCNEITPNQGSYLRNILEEVFVNNWNKSWPIVGEYILSKNYYNWSELRRLLKQYHKFNDEQLLVWMDQHPQQAPQKVVSFIKTYAKSNTDSIHWTPLMGEMLDRYHSNEELLSRLSNELHSYSWTGSVIPLLESRKELVELLLEHPKEEVKSFGIDNSRYFEARIQEEKRRDKNERLGF